MESYIVTTSSTAASTLATGLSTDAAAVFTDASFASYGTPVASNVVTIEPTGARALPVSCLVPRGSVLCVSTLNDSPVTRHPAHTRACVVWM